MIDREREIDPPLGGAYKNGGDTWLTAAGS
jgi:hypothetical protein